MDNLLKLRDIVDATKQFLAGKDKQNKNIEDLFVNLEIKEYLPILVKTTSILSLIIQKNCYESEYYELKLAEFYKNIFFYVILGQYANIDTTDESLFTFDNYDLLYPIWGRYILNFCKDDFDMFLRLLENSMNLYNIQDITDSLKNINYDKLSEATESNKEIIKELNKNSEVVQALNNMAILNSPQISSIINQVKKEIVKEEE